jgi:hypothetical protein
MEGTTVSLFAIKYKSGALDIGDEAHKDKILSYGHDGITAAPATPEDVAELRLALSEKAGARMHRAHYGVSTFEAAVALAELLGAPYTAADHGPHTHPRYTVFVMPHVGDAVSYSFNGDSYPDGEIVKVGTGPKAVIVTSTGSRYYRNGPHAPSWTKQGGTWSLISGHHNERNPSF